ncbi:MAG: kelch repeat-containing protein [Planctomycetota bacterium]
MVFWSPLLKRAVLVGGRKVTGGQFAVTLDPASGAWSGLSDARPKLDKRQAVSAGSAAAIDPEGRRIYCLLGRRLAVFDVEKKSWSETASSDLLGELTAAKMAFSPGGGEVVLVGSEVDLARCGWMSALAFDVAAGKWRRLELGTGEARARHAERVAVLRALEELVGRVRHAWYRDPAGRGTDAEREAISAKLAALAEMPGGESAAAGAAPVSAAVKSGKLLDALKSARKLHREFEAAVEAASPVPPARRNSPLVCDPVNKVLVLFGGDRDDSTTNDTWILDPAKPAWRRGAPKTAPSPRAGHGLVYLPKCGRIALWDGYRHNSTRDYRRHQADLLPRRELWLYDAKADSWTPAASWDAKDASLPRRAGMMGLGFFGYGSDYRAMALTALPGDELLFVGAGRKTAGKGKSRVALNAAWRLEVSAGASAGATAGAAPNSRFERTGKCPAAYCEDPAAPTPAISGEIKPNEWVKLPAPPRVPYDAQRRCPYGNAAWNPDAGEILHWGGGHCACSTSVVTHWSPASNRMVQAYDRDEPYGSNGGGPGGHSLFGRPWVDTHAYQCYGYDSRHKLMLVLRGRNTYLYDPVTMCWLKKRVKNPFDGHCYTGHIISTPHGAVAWGGTSGYMGKEGRGLWLFDGKGWKNIVKPGDAPQARVDRSASCYDSKRDRVLLFPNGSKGLGPVGPITAYSFKTGSAEKISAVNPELVPMLGGMQVLYVPHADSVLALFPVNDGEGRPCHPLLDLASMKWSLLYAGQLTIAKKRDQGVVGRGRGMVYDAGRKLIYVITETGGLYALRLEPRVGGAP